MLDCYCDYDSPRVYSNKIVRAKKEYRCEECNKPIRIGERYEYAFGVIDDYAYQPHTCLGCVGIRNFMTINIPCFCWAHGNLIEDAKNTVEAAYHEAPDEVKGLAFGLGRRLVAMKRARAAA